MSKGKKKALLHKLQQYDKQDIIDCIGEIFNVRNINKLISKLEKIAPESGLMPIPQSSTREYVPGGSMLAHVGDLRLKLQRQESVKKMAEIKSSNKNKISQLESKLKIMQRQSSLLTMEVNDFRKRETRRGRNSITTGQFSPTTANDQRIRSIISYVIMKRKIKPSIQMKPLHWKYIPDNQIKNTIWENITKIEEQIIRKNISIQKQNDQDDKPFLDDLFNGLTSVNNKLLNNLQSYLYINEYDSDALELDIIDYNIGSNIKNINNEILEMIKRFAQREANKMGLFYDLQQLFPMKLNEKISVKIIDSFRAKNVIDGLHGLKIQTRELKHAILMMDEEILTIDLLKKLINLVPTPEEVTNVLRYNGNKKDLGICERFFIEFKKIMNVKERLYVWMFSRELEKKYTENMNKLLELTYMEETIKDSEHFKTVLAVILACGNFVNSNNNNSNGRKHGFLLEALSTISKYNTTDNSVCILGYVYKYLRDNFVDSLEWVDDFEELPDVIKIKSGDLGDEITNMVYELHRIGIMLSEDSTDEYDRFFIVMDKFYESTLSKVQDLQQSWSDAMGDIQELAISFGERVNEIQFKTEEFFSIFNDFRNAFIESQNKMDKIEENEKEIKELIILKKIRKAKAERQKKYTGYDSDDSLQLSGIDSDSMEFEDIE